MFCTLVNAGGQISAVHDFGEGSFSIKVRHHDIGKYLITIFKRHTNRGAVLDQNLVHWRLGADLSAVLF